MKSIKENRAIRILAKPYKDWRKKRDHELYLRTPDHFYLQSLKGIHKGKRCFIIGNGPSLTAADLDMLKGEYTFASNRIFKIFDQTEWRPTYYFCVDDKVMREIESELNSYDLGHMFLAYGTCTIHEATNKLSLIYGKSLAFDVNQNTYNKTTTYISEDVSDHSCDGTTVTFHAIQMAIYMGFDEIYLLGVDCNYARTADASGKISVDNSVVDYFDKKRYNGNIAVPLSHQYAYMIAREYCDNHGITICNATRGGKLEVFKRVDFDKLME